MELAIERNKIYAADAIRSFTEEDRLDVPKLLRPLSKNKEMRLFLAKTYPFLFLLYFGLLFESSINIWIKIILVGLFYLISYSYNKLVLNSALSFMNKINNNLSNLLLSLF